MYWLIWGSEASIMFSKRAQKFVPFVFVFSSSHACLCVLFIMGWRRIWKREKTEEKLSLVLCSLLGLPPSKGGEEFQTSPHYFFLLGVKSRCWEGTMSKVSSWRRTQLDTSCDSLIVMHLGSPDPEALLLLRSYTSNCKCDSLACQPILGELISYYFTNLFVK